MEERCVQCFLRDVHQNFTYVCCNKAKLWRDLGRCGTPVTVVMNTLQLFGCRKGRFFFFLKCATICWLIIEEIEDTKDALKPKTFYWLNILVAGSFCTTEGDERWTTELLQVSQDSSQEKRSSTSSTFKFPKWSAKNHIISDKCVFCLPVVLTPLMTINAECALYSTFFFF